MWGMHEIIAWLQYVYREASLEASGAYKEGILLHMWVVRKEFRRRHRVCFMCGTKLLAPSRVRCTEGCRNKLSMAWRSIVREFYWVCG